MHEFSLAHSILEIVLDSARQNRATRVRTVDCRIGAMRQIVPSYLSTAFEACSQQSLAEGADLIVDTVPARLDCQACSHSGDMTEITFQCPSCGSTRIELRGGTTMDVTSITIDQEESNGHRHLEESAGAQRY